MEPGEILVAVREERGWSTTQAAKRAGLGDQQLRNLESGKTPPDQVKVGTLLALVELYWPDLSLVELLPGARFRLEPTSPAVGGLLLARSSSKRLHEGMRAMADQSA